MSYQKPELFFSISTYWAWNCFKRISRWTIKSSRTGDFCVWARKTIISVRTHSTVSNSSSSWNFSNSVVRTSDRVGVWGVRTVESNRAFLCTISGRSSTCITIVAGIARSDYSSSLTILTCRAFFALISFLKSGFNIIVSSIWTNSRSCRSYWTIA